MPTGNFRSHARNGSSEPQGATFKALMPVGIRQPGEYDGDDRILTLIQQLDGLDPHNANTMLRYTCFHGTSRKIYRINHPVMTASASRMPT